MTVSLCDKQNTATQTKHKLDNKLAYEKVLSDLLIKNKNEASKLEELKSTILAVKDKL